MSGIWLYPLPLVKIRDLEFRGKTLKLLFLGNQPRARGRGRNNKTPCNVAENWNIVKVQAENNI